MSGETCWLEVTEVRDAGSVRVCLRGELDLASAPMVAERLRALRARREQVVLDLDEIAFIDMSGLRMVLAAAEEASQDGGALEVTRGSASVRRLIELVWADGQPPFDGSRR